MKTAQTTENTAVAASADDIDTSSWKEASLEIQGWMTPQISKRIVGRAVEHIQVEGEFGLQDVVKVKLGLPCEALSGSGDEQKTVLLKKGEIIAVRVSANLQTLLRCVKNQCAVEIIPKGEQKLKKGRKMRMYKLRYDGQLADAITAPAPVSGSKDSNSDDLPF